MSTLWIYDRWTTEHALPIGVTERFAVGQKVNAGDVIAAGATLAGAVRLAGARRLGLTPEDFSRQLRVRVGHDVTAGTVLARVGRRFPRAVSAPIDGRIVHLTADGDVFLAPAVDRWAVRSTLDGVITRSDDGAVTVEGTAWSLTGTAAYGPDAVGELTLGTESPTGEMPASRIDVRLEGRIMIVGARVSAEVMTRAHACGIAGLVAGAAPAAGLRVVYGDTVTASAFATREDRPTVLCLMGFGSAALPREIHEALASLVGSRAAIHTASARLLVFAPREIGDLPTEGPAVALAGDYGSVRAIAAPDDAGIAELASGVRSSAVRAGSELVPAGNVRRLGER